MINRKELELYVHIPFCVRKCEYCDFLSFPMDRKTQESYVTALLTEVDKAVLDGENYQVCSVFFGGGTPSVLPGEWIVQILERLKKRFLFQEQTEITLEANPGTVTAEKLKLYRKAGFNRISFGCQSADSAELRKLGRIHSWEDFLESYWLARNAGFENINADLMSGLPGQKLESWKRSLLKIADLHPEHISAYSLILEEGTPFYDRQDSLQLPGEEEEREMYECTHDILAACGYHQYEISNYAKPGYECRHNLGYWTGTDYLGLGLGAASLIGHTRFCNTKDLGLYLSSSGCSEEIREEQEKLNMEDRKAEFMILGLRLTDGVCEKEFEKRFGQSLGQVYGPVLKKYQSLGLLERSGTRIRLTRKGISLSNMVMAEFLN